MNGFVQNLKTAIEGVDRTELCGELIQKEQLFNKYLHSKLSNYIEEPGPHPTIGGLFGYANKNGIQPDFLSKGDGTCAVIEVKIIRKDGECELKNGMAQVLEQALCYSAKCAVLLIFDCGRAKAKSWDEDDLKYINAFCNINLEQIRLYIVRVRNLNVVQADVYCSSTN